MESVTELLLEKLSELSSRSLRHFWITFQQTQPYYTTPWMLLGASNIQDLVFFMVQTYGQQAVEKTEQILQKMKKTDQQQKLPGRRFGTQSKTTRTEHVQIIKVVPETVTHESLLSVFLLRETLCA